MYVWSVVIVKLNVCHKFVSVRPFYLVVTSWVVIKTTNEDESFTGPFYLKSKSLYPFYALIYSFRAF